jgi:hypothetical protein
MSHRAPKLALALALAVLACPSTVAAQQVGGNVNVLPVYKTIVFDPAQGKYVWVDDGLDYLRGNLYGQRLNEPAILVSSRTRTTSSFSSTTTVRSTFRRTNPSPGPGPPRWPRCGTASAASWRGWPADRP